MRPPISARARPSLSKCRRNCGANWPNSACSDQRPGASLPGVLALHVADGTCKRCRRATSCISMSDKKQPVPVEGRYAPVEAIKAGEIDAFIRQARAIAAIKASGSGRLILSLDATMSRQPTWDMACALQGEMFDAVGKAGSLNVQLVYFRGLARMPLVQFRHRHRCLEASDDQHRMPRRQHPDRQGARPCAEGDGGGKGQCAGLYRRRDGRKPIDDLAEKAASLGLHGVPVFVFQEGQTIPARKRHSRKSRGCPKALGSALIERGAATLAGLLSAVAVFATGGLKALEARGRPEDRLLIEHMRGGGTG